MDIDDLREFCLGFSLTEECLPFDEDTLVFKVGGKMFACASINDFTWIVVKCDPDRSILLREEHEDITTAWHFNKKHWISIGLNGDLRNDFIMSLIKDSYDLVFNALPKRIREQA